MTDLPVDEREWGAAFLRKRAEAHCADALALSRAEKSPDRREAFRWHVRQARALHHEAELIEKGPHKGEVE